MDGAAGANPLRESNCGGNQKQPIGPGAADRQSNPPSTSAFSQALVRQKRTCLGYPWLANRKAVYRNVLLPIQLLPIQRRSERCEEPTMLWL